MHLRSPTSKGGRGREGKGERLRGKEGKSRIFASRCNPIADFIGTQFSMQKNNKFDLG